MLFSSELQITLSIGIKNWKMPLQVFTIIEEQETLVQYTHSKKVLQIENSVLPASLPINPY